MAAWQESGRRGCVVYTLKEFRASTKRVRIGRGPQAVSGLFTRPDAPRACLVLGPGAGGGLEQPLLAEVARGLAAHSIATLRYQFPYQERKGRRPDGPAVCHRTIREAVAKAAVLCPTVPLFAGGKSFGGRMTSQAQALDPLVGVRGLLLVGFPLHPPGRPSLERADHLSDVTIPMRFLWGTRDSLAEGPLFKRLMKRLRRRANPRRGHRWRSFVSTCRPGAGRTDAEVLEKLLDGAAAWMKSSAAS